VIVDSGLTATDSTPRSAGAAQSRRTLPVKPASDKVANVHPRIRPSPRRARVQPASPAPVRSPARPIDGTTLASPLCTFPLDGTCAWRDRARCQSRIPIWRGDGVWRRARHPDACLDLTEPGTQTHLRLTADAPQCFPRQGSMPPARSGFVGSNGRPPGARGPSVAFLDDMSRRNLADYLDRSDRTSYGGFSYVGEIRVDPPHVDRRPRPVVLAKRVIRRGRAMLSSLGARIRRLPWLALPGSVAPTRSRCSVKPRRAAQPLGQLGLARPRSLNGMAQAYDRDAARPTTGCTPPSRS